MSLDEFCKYDFDEFEHICNAWSDMNDARSREEWERTRTLAAICIQPHMRQGKKITPRQLIPLPWDHISPNSYDQAPKLSPREKQKRFEELAGKMF